MDAVTELGEDGLRAVVADLLHRQVASFERVGGGGNNRLYKLALADGSCVALKACLDTADDRRDRLGAEFTGLRFLWSHGVRCVPQAIAQDRLRGLAIYDWIDGEPVAAPTAADLDAVLGFVADLAGLSSLPTTRDLPEASEACLSVRELGEQLRRRLTRLQAVDRRDLARYLEGEFLPLLDAHWCNALDGAEIAGIDAEATLPAALQTLSPSDLGFHNAIRRPDGTLAFVDFEYFGRDDPVKLTADFLLHPAMSLDATARRQFLAGCRNAFGDDPLYDTRLRLTYPLYSLRWCLILLNEFLPERWARRRFAAPDRDRDEMLLRQLDLARGMLRRVNDVNGSLFNDG